MEKSIEQLMKLEPGLEYLGLTNLKEVHWNHCTPVLYEHVIKKNEGVLTHLGPIVVVRPGKSTGRAPRDKFIVKDENTADKIHWSTVNVPYDAKKFDYIFERVKAYLQDREIYVQDAYAGADEKYRVAIRVITEFAWQALFARNMLLRIRDRKLLPGFQPEFTVFAMPKFLGNPELDELNSETFILVNFTRKIVLIGGTYYAGEIKKSVFTVLNFLLPQKKVLSMHCSANVGKKGDTALFLDFPEPEKPRCRRTRTAPWSAMTNTAGVTTAFLILRAAVMPKRSACPKKQNLKFTKRPESSAPFWKTLFSIRLPVSST